MAGVDLLTVPAYLEKRLATTGGDKSSRSHGMLGLKLNTPSTESVGVWVSTSILSFSPQVLSSQMNLTTVKWAPCVHTIVY